MEISDKLNPLVPHKMNEIVYLKHFFTTISSIIFFNSDALSNLPRIILA